MHQQQVEVVDPERGEAFVDRFGKVGRAKILVADLGGEEDVLARQAGGAHRLTDRTFRAVFARGVNMAVAGLECGEHCLR